MCLAWLTGVSGGVNGLHDNYGLKKWLVSLDLLNASKGAMCVYCGGKGGGGGAQTGGDSCQLSAQQTGAATLFSMCAPLVDCLPILIPLKIVYPF